MGDEETGEFNRVLVGFDFSEHFDGFFAIAFGGGVNIESGPEVGFWWEGEFFDFYFVFNLFVGGGALVELGFEQNNVVGGVEIIWKCFVNGRVGSEITKEDVASTVKKSGTPKNQGQVLFRQVGAVDDFVAYA